MPGIVIDLKRGVQAEPGVESACEMATYIIGDVQGQWRELERLLAKVGFDRQRDRLWFVGDLVNRGPRSLEVVRFVKSLGDRATLVLGNHDLHLIGRALGVADARRRDTLDDLLDADDCHALIKWLRRQPLIFRARGCVLVHAGLLPAWSVTTAVRLAREVESVLRSPHAGRLLEAYEKGRDARWHTKLEGIERWTVILNALTRMRTCYADGRMELEFNGPPAERPAGTLPWYDFPSRNSSQSFIVFGHWAALGLRTTARYAALDSGCAWGNSLSAIRLEDRQLFSVACEAPSASRRS
jgi:bis(5'-nucleosyl)-tetraphosphatase (symmetrical)